MTDHIALDPPNSVSPRPQYDGMVDVDSLVPGDRIELVNASYGSMGLYLVAGSVREVDAPEGGRRCRVVQLRKLYGAAEIAEHFLADMGLEPYFDDYWNAVNHVLTHRCAPECNHLEREAGLLYNDGQDLR